MVPCSYGHIVWTCREGLEYHFKKFFLFFFFFNSPRVREERGQCLPVKIDKDGFTDFENNRLTIKRPLVRKDRFFNKILVGQNHQSYKDRDLRHLTIL